MRVHPSETLKLWDSVVTIGAFDGVHRGHQALVRRAVIRAAQLGVPSVAYTFDPPPRAYFQNAEILTPGPEKTGRLGALGLDHTVLAHFNAAYAARSAEDFLEELAELNPAEIWVGKDFRFGHGQAGDVEMLGRRFAVRVFEPVRCGVGEVISSTRVRSLMSQGFVGNALNLLGWNTREEGLGRLSVDQVAYSGYNGEAPALFPGPRRCLEFRPVDHSFVW